MRSVAVATLPLTDTVGHVSEFLSMLLPLQTLAGWPASPDPSLLQVLGLLVGFPVLAIVIISVLVKASSLASSSRGSASTYTEPTWVGGGQHALDGDQRSTPAAIEAATAQEPAAADQGGASVRW
jgi:hypothetical protein